MSIEDHTVSFSLEVNVEPGLTEMRKFNTVAYRGIRLCETLTGSPHLKVGMRIVQEFMMWVNKLRLAYLALQAARMAAGDPLAWGLAAVSVAEVAVELSGY